MILLLALATATASSPSEPKARFEACSRLAETDPTAALAEAGSWRIVGGGMLARQCEGLAYVTQARWIPAATAFEAAAREADNTSDGRAGNLWVQAGNAALAGRDAARARVAFDAAIVRGQAAGADLGELYLDRARARVALGDMPGGRQDIDAALKLVPADPLAWLLSATLARRTNDLPRAQTDVAEAARRSPDDAQVALEAGNLAILAGNAVAARTAWIAAVRNAPEAAAGKAAAEALSRLDAKP